MWLMESFNSCGLDVQRQENTKKGKHNVHSEHSKSMMCCRAKQKVNKGLSKLY